MLRRTVQKLLVLIFIWKLYVKALFPCIYRKASNTEALRSQNGAGVTGVSRKGDGLTAVCYSTSTLAGWHREGAPLTAYYRIIYFYSARLISLRVICCTGPLVLICAFLTSAQATSLQHLDSSARTAQPLFSRAHGVPGVLVGKALQAHSAPHRRWGAGWCFQSGIGVRCLPPRSNPGWTGIGKPIGQESQATHSSSIRASLVLVLIIIIIGEWDYHHRCEGKGVTTAFYTM